MGFYIECFLVLEDFVGFIELVFFCLWGGGLYIFFSPNSFKYSGALCELWFIVLYSSRFLYSMNGFIVGFMMGCEFF